MRAGGKRDDLLDIVSRKQAGKLRSRRTGEVIGFENIELISDRPIDVWLDEFRQVKKEYPNHILIASIIAVGADANPLPASKILRDSFEACPGNGRCCLLGAERTANCSCSSVYRTVSR